MITDNILLYPISQVANRYYPIYKKRDDDNYHLKGRGHYPRAGDAVDIKVINARSSSDNLYLAANNGLLVDL